MTESKILALALKIRGIQCIIYLIGYLGQGGLVVIMAFGGEGFGAGIGWIVASLLPMVLHSVAAYIMFLSSCSKQA